MACPATGIGEFDESARADGGTEDLVTLLGDAHHWVAYHWVAQWRGQDHTSLPPLAARLAKTLSLHECMQRDDEFKGSLRVDARIGWPTYARRVTGHRTRAGHG